MKLNLNPARVSTNFQDAAKAYSRRDGFDAEGLRELVKAVAKPVPTTTTTKNEYYSPFSIIPSVTSAPAAGAKINFLF